MKQLEDHDLCGTGGWNKSGAGKKLEWDGVVRVELCRTLNSVLGWKKLFAWIEKKEDRKNMGGEGYVKLALKSGRSSDMHLPG